MLKDRKVPDLERPLGARSLIASLLLRSQPPRMRAGRLVQWCRLFGVSEGAARVALSRMVDRGELTSSAGMYELAGRVGGRRRAQDWSLNPRLQRWTGDWRLALVTTTTRAATERGALRDAMRRLRMAELREGMWTRPDNVPRASAPADAWDVAHAQCTWWTARPDDDPVVLAATLFDPAEWAGRADRLRVRLDRVTAGLDHAPERRLAEAFAAGAAALAHVRADPLLPAALGPSTDAGDELRVAYRAYETEFSGALRAWFRAHA
jgi:phenylacetic acid degradation operon negative regulatory protein